MYVPCFRWQWLSTTTMAPDSGLRSRTWHSWGTLHWMPLHSQELCWKVHWVFEVPLEMPSSWKDVALPSCQGCQDCQRLCCSPQYVHTGKLEVGSHPFCRMFEHFENKEYVFPPTGSCWGWGLRTSSRWGRRNIPHCSQWSRSYGNGSSRRRAWSRGCSRRQQWSTLAWSGSGSPPACDRFSSSETSRTGTDSWMTV